MSQTALTLFRRDLAGRPQRFVERDPQGGVIGHPRNFVWEGARPRAEYAATLDDELDYNGQPIRVFSPEGLWHYNVDTANYEAYYYVRDHLGSVRAVFDGEGVVIARYDYDPYGRPHQTYHSGRIDPRTGQPIAFDFLFTGHLYHPRSGLYFAPFRAYDPTLGRWISKDPIDIAGGINLYEYVEGDPVNWVDPLGHERKQGKTPNSMWPKPPSRQRGNKWKWNSEGYYDAPGGKRFHWDDRSHGAGQRGNGGHWDEESTGERFREDGTNLDEPPMEPSANDEGTNSSISIEIPEPTTDQIQVLITVTSLGVLGALALFLLCPFAAAS